MPSSHANQCDIMISKYAQGSTVAQLVVREIEEGVKQRLKRRAELHGRSMEEEIRCILREAAKAPDRPVVKLGSMIAARFRGQGLLHELPELRGEPARPADFKS
jgi:antitoxin FitA